MKEKFSKILAWAKAHPWIAGLIVAGVIVLGYLAYKRSAASSGTQAADNSQAAPVDSSGVTTPDYSGIGSGGGGAGGAASGPGSSIGSIPAFQDTSSSLNPFGYSAPDMTPALSAIGLPASSDQSAAVPVGGGRTIAGALDSLQPYQTIVPGALAKSATGTIAAPVRAQAPAPVTTSSNTAKAASSTPIVRAPAPVQVTTSGKTAKVASTAVIKKAAPVSTPASKVVLKTTATATGGRSLSNTNPLNLIYNSLIRMR